MRESTEDLQTKMRFSRVFALQKNLHDESAYVNAMTQAGRFELLLNEVKRKGDAFSSASMAHFRHA